MKTLMIGIFSVAVSNIALGQDAIPVPRDTNVVRMNMSLPDSVLEKVRKDNFHGMRLYEHYMKQQRGLELFSLQPDISETGISLDALNIGGSESDSIYIDQSPDELVNADDTPSKQYRLIPVRPFDSRFEIGNLALTTDENKNIVSNSASVLGIIASNQLARTRTGYVVKDPITLEDRFGLCSDEPYCRQPSLCLGTAFLVAKNIVITARHNLDMLPLKNMSFLVGYTVQIKTGLVNLNFNTEDIYRAVRIIKSDKLAQLDLVVIQLDRPVAGGDALKIEKDFTVKAAGPVYALGYPLGLPMKYITNASISGPGDIFSFYTTLDTFKGNSGSPVFDRNTHKLIGVLVEGGIDLTSRGNCQISRLCAERSCLGEKVINVSILSDHIFSLIK